MAPAVNLKEIQSFQIYEPFTILSNLINTVTKFIGKGVKLFKPSEPQRVFEYVEKSQDIQRQMLGILLPYQEDYYSRANLRSLVGLTPLFEEDPQAIRSLEGAISNITKEKIDVTEFIRNMRDNR